MRKLTLEKRLTEQEQDIQKISELLSYIKNFENGGFDSISFSKMDVEVIKQALFHHWSAIKADYDDKKKAIECGSEDGNLKSHSEEQIFLSCVQLMQGIMEHFQQWLDWIGIDIHDLDAEEEFSYRISIKELVSHLFLQYTSHSGGTSSRAKCRQLGLEPYDELIFTIKNESEDC